MNVGSNTKIINYLRSVVIGVLIMFLLILSALILKPLFLLIEILFIIDIVIFVFNLSSYLSYRDRINQIKINGKYIGPNYKKTAKLYFMVGILGLIFILINAVNKDGLSISLIIVTLYMFYLSLKRYKKCNY